MNGFFGINGGEMFVLFVIALIVLGPQRLPQYARKAAEWTREIRAIALDFRQGLEREIEEIEGPLREVRDEVAKPLREMSEEISRPLKEVGDDLEATSKQVQSGFSWKGPRPGAGPQPEDAAEDLRRLEAGEDLLENDES